ncbi:MAG: hypothetical protein BWY93_01795 [Euryarchaeota archaeon ADurb.BinA087]|nr:MAG: hypothetical protein BWY93_01795 [Euryarchaeota archaeon ADurb.BinA087]
MGIIVLANVNQTPPSGSGSSCSIIYSYEHNNVHISNVSLINIRATYPHHHNRMRLQAFPLSLW